MRESETTHHWYNLPFYSTYETLHRYTSSAEHPLCKLYLVDHVLSHLHIFLDFSFLLAATCAKKLGQGIDVRQQWQAYDQKDLLPSSPTVAALVLARQSYHLLGGPMQCKHRHTQMEQFTKSHPSGCSNGDLPRNLCLQTCTKLLMNMRQPTFCFVESLKSALHKVALKDCNYRHYYSVLGLRQICGILKVKQTQA